MDPCYFRKPKQGMALTALAGPVSNLLLALLLLLCSRLIYDFAPYSDLWNLVFGFLLDTAVLSIGLGVFNLVPIRRWTAPRSWRPSCRTGPTSS